MLKEKSSHSFSQHCENTDLGLYLMTECPVISFLFKYVVVMGKMSFNLPCMQKIKASRVGMRGRACCGTCIWTCFHIV